MTTRYDDDAGVAFGKRIGDSGGGFMARAAAYTGIGGGGRSPATRVVPRGVGVTSGSIRPTFRLDQSSADVGVAVDGGPGSPFHPP